MIFRELPGADKKGQISIRSSMDSWLVIKSFISQCLIGRDLHFKKLSAKVKPRLKTIQNPSKAPTDIQ